MADGQQQTYDLSSVAKDPGFVNASAQDKIAYLSAHDPDFAKASPKDKAGYLNHILGYDQPTQIERQAQGLTPDQQEAGYRRAYAAERERGGIVLTDADIATLGLGGIGVGRTIATQGIKAAAKPIIKGLIGAAGGSAAGAYGGRELGRVVGHPDEGAQIGATLGGFAGGFFGGMGKEPIPEKGPFVPASESPGLYRGPSSVPKPEPEPIMIPAAKSPGAYRGPSSAVAPLGSPENPGWVAPLPNRMPTPKATPNTSPFSGATPSSASLPDVPLPTAGAYSPPSMTVPGLSRVSPAPIKTSPFGNATPSNALNADVPIPKAGTYNPPSIAVPGLTEAVVPPTGLKGSIAKPSGRLILSPEEARAESAMQQIATQRAKQHGMLYAAGMRPAGGGRVPLTPTATESFEYGGQKSAYEPPSEQVEIPDVASPYGPAPVGVSGNGYSRIGGNGGPYAPLEPFTPVHPDEALEMSNRLGRPVMASEVPDIRRRLDAERNISSGLAGNRTDVTGNIREAHRATLEKKGRP